MADPLVKIQWKNNSRPAMNGTNLNAMQTNIETYVEDNMEEMQRKVDNVVAGYVTGYDEYSNTSTYAVGDYCIYNNKLYVCNTAIATAEDFDSSKWTETSINEIISGVKSDVETNTNHINIGGIKLYKLAETGDLSTGTISLADNVNNYVALVVITGYVTDGYIDSHIIVPWVSQLDASGNFAGWRARTFFK